MDDNVFDEPKTSEQTIPTVVIETDIINDLPNESDGQHVVELPDQTGNHLDAIKEVDEHSNYGLDNDDENDDVSINDTEHAKNGKPVTLVETKRKLFSRQSSSASLITKNTDSFGDSGIETMDSVNCSETREQPDVYDVDMGDDDGKDGKSTPSSFARDQRAIYDDNEDDEDMIEAHLVHESLSRVSSTESMNKLNELDTEKPNERVLNFVNEYKTVYVEVIGDPDPEVIQAKRESDERFDKAQTLQKAILKHSFTSPQLTVYKSTAIKPQTAKPSVNGISCSHIDIDLSCEAPPKADIKSYRNFSERVKSARTSREMFSPLQSESKMSVIDMTDRINSGGSSSPSSERSRWPLRPLTRPRSPLTKKPGNKIDKHISLELKCVTMAEMNKHGLRGKIVRAKSAVPIGRCISPVHQGPKTSSMRPQTATIPYTTSRLDADRKRDILVSQPFANADELYPNKSMLTSFHHGFKSFWPIGRKVNVLQKKRPFEAFEMNSYSRAIERCQFPFKGDHSISLKPASPLIPKTEIKPLIKCFERKIVSLSMGEVHPLRKPTSKQLSLYLTPRVTPRSAR